MAHVDNVWTGGYRQLMPPATRSFALCRPAQGNPFDTPSFNHSSACPKIENPHKIIETLSFHQLHHTFISWIYHGFQASFPHQWPQAIETNKVQRVDAFWTTSPVLSSFPGQNRDGLAVGKPWWHWISMDIRRSWCQKTFGGWIRLLQLSEREITFMHDNIHNIHSQDMFCWQRTYTFRT